MSWPFDPSEPRITPAAILDFACKRLGLTTLDIALPPTLLATFQTGPLAALQELTAAKRFSIVERYPRLEEGIAGTGKILGGMTPGGRSVGVGLLPIGAPAAVLYLELTIARGVRNIFVCGSAGSLQPHIPIGSVVVVTGAEREDGTSHHYLPAGDVVGADAAMIRALVEASHSIGIEAAPGRSWTIDAVFRETSAAIARHQEKGIAVVDMEAAAIFALAQVRGVRAGVVVAVSDEVHLPWNPGFDMPSFREAQRRIAEIVVGAADRLADQGMTPS